MTEHESFGASAPEQGPSIELQLPASLASKETVSRALDYLVPMDEEDAEADGYFELEKGVLIIHRSPDGLQSTITLAPNGVLGGGRGFAVGSNHEVTDEERYRLSYQLMQESDADGETVFQKVNWPGKQPQEEALDVSEAEAKILIAKMTDPRRELPPVS